MGIAVEPYIKVKNAIMAAQGRGDDVALSASWAFTGWLLALAHLLLLPLPLVSSFGSHSWLFPVGASFFFSVRVLNRALCLSPSFLCSLVLILSSISRVPFGLFALSSFFCTITKCGQQVKTQ